MKVIDINIERCHRLIPLQPKVVFRLREPVAVRRAIHPRDQRLLHPPGHSHRDIHLGRHRTNYREIRVNVRLDRRIPEVDLREMPVVLLRQIERELVVDGQLVVTRPFARVPVVMIRRVTLLAMIPRQSLRAAVTLARLPVAMLRLAVALALLARPSVHRVPEITRLALLTVTARRQVATRLHARLPILAGAVPVALTLRTVGKVPPMHQTLHLLVRPSITSWETLAQSRHRTIVTPTTRGIISALRTRSIKPALTLPRHRRAALV